jgi:integrase
LESGRPTVAYRDPQSAKTAFAVVADEWQKSLRRQSRKTRHDYEEILTLYVLPKWKDWQIGAIRWEDVSDWIDHLIKTPGKRGKQLGPARITKIYRVLSMVLKRAVQTGRIVASPAVDHELPRKPDDDDHVYLSHEQLHALSQACDRYEPFVRLLGYTGIRWGEGIGATGERFLIPQRRLRIVKAYSDVRGVLELGPVKTHEKRSVPLLASVADEVSPLASAAGRTGLVFTAPEGGPLRYSNFRSRFFDPAVKASGLGGLGVTPHKLRHTAASLAIAAGADVKVVQLMLGHKSAAMTLDVYGHLWPDRLDEVADALDAGRIAALSMPRARQAA